MVFFVAIFLVEVWEKPEEEWKREEKKKMASACGVAACTAFDV